MDYEREGAYVLVMKTIVAPLTVVPRDYPELALLAWNRNPTRPIPAEEAFGLYEGNWRHVDVDHLTPREADLIEVLVMEHGHGHLMAA